MINMSDISFQPMPVTATVTPVAGGTDSQKTGNLDSLGIFKNVLGSTHNLSVMASTRPSTRQVLVEPDLSDQKLIQLEEIDATALEDVRELAVGSEITKLANKEIGVVENAHKIGANKLLDPLEKDIKTTAPQERIPTQGVQTGVTELAGAGNSTVKIGEQNSIETHTRPVSLAELRNVTTESPRLRHSASLKALPMTNQESKTTAPLERIPTQGVQTGVTELAGAGNSTVKIGEQNSIETHTRPVSLSEFRSVRTESSRLRHAAILKTLPMTNQEINISETQGLNPQQGLQSNETELADTRYLLPKTGNQAAIGLSVRSVPLSELRNAKAEDPRLRHLQSLAVLPVTKATDVTGNITDKAIDIVNLSIKQPFNPTVDVDEPIPVDKFEVDKTLTALKVNPGAGEIKVESILGPFKELDLGVDTKIAKTVGHTPISIQSMNGSLELSGIAAWGNKTVAPLPISTLALRQPGLDQSLATNISYMINEDIQSANINVKPTELGPINVQLAVHADHLSVTIAASQAQTRESLESTLPRLREQFSSMGFTSVDVSVGDHQSQRQSRESHTEGGNNTLSNGYTSSDDRGDIEVIDLPVQSRVTHSGIVDTFA